MFGNMREVEAKFKDGQIDGKGESCVRIGLQIGGSIYDNIKIFIKLLITFVLACSCLCVVSLLGDLACLS